jgi:hypothetical protein
MVASYILKEDADRLLQENTDRLVVDDGDVIGASVLTDNQAFAGSRSSDVTASISPGANKVLIAVHCINRITGTDAAQTASGLSLTWAQIGTFNSGTSRRVTLFRAQTGASPGSGAVTFSFNSGIVASAWAIIELSNAKLGSNGVDAIGSYASANDSPASPTTETNTGTITPSGDYTNATLVVGYWVTGGGTLTTPYPAGYKVLVDRTNMAVLFSPLPDDTTTLYHVARSLKTAVVVELIKEPTSLSNKDRSLVSRGVLRGVLRGV